MARGRDIKPGFFDSDELAEVSRDHRLLFIALWTVADREGRIEDRPSRLKVHSFPLDADMTPERISSMIDDLAEARGKFVRRYEVSGMRCIVIGNFKKHQHIHPKEKASELPEPPPVRELPGITGKDSNSPCNSALPSEPSSLLGAPSLSSSLSASDPDRARSNAGANNTPSGYDLLCTFGNLRREILSIQAPPGSERPKDSRGHAQTFSEQLTVDEAADVVETMRLFFAHVKAGDRGWDAPKNATDPSFAFGSWRSAFPALREELHGLTPKAAERPIGLDPNWREQCKIG